MPDLGTNRRRVWRKTGLLNAQGAEIVEDTEYDLVSYGGTEVYEPSVSTRAIRKDGQTTDHEYVGIHWLNQNDTIAVTPQGGGFGGLRNVAGA